MSATTTEPTSVTVEDLRTGLTELLAQVKDSGTPLTVDGGIVMLPAAEYERLLDRDDRLGLLEQIRDGIRAFEAGKCLTVAEVREQHRQKYAAVTP